MNDGLLPPGQPVTVFTFSRSEVCANILGTMPTQELPVLRGGGRGTVIPGEPVGNFSLSWLLATGEPGQSRPRRPRMEC